MKIKIYFIFAAGLFLECGYIFAQESPAAVKFIAELPTPGEYTHFANGGWNGNWYVGYEHGWISQLPPVNKESYEKAYIGAKLGRAKTNEQIKEIIDHNGSDLGTQAQYKIMIGFSRSKDIVPEGRELVLTENIPYEGSAVMALEGVGESRWFWSEIKMSELSDREPNYIHIWSEDKQLNGPETAPILASGAGSDDLENSFLAQGKELKTIKYLIGFIKMLKTVAIIF